MSYNALYTIWIGILFTSPEQAEAELSEILSQLDPDLLASLEGDLSVCDDEREMAERLGYRLQTIYQDQEADSFAVGFGFILARCSHLDPVAEFDYISHLEKASHVRSGLIRLFKERDCQELSKQLKIYSHVSLL